jgi:hypothetical protein
LAENNGIVNTMHPSRYKGLCSAFLAFLAAGAAQALDYPAAAKKPVTDAFHGTQSRPRST